MADTVFEVGSRHSRDEIAEFLYDAATSVHEGEMTVASGEDRITLDIPQEAEFEVEVVRDDGDGSEGYGIEFEIEWETGEDADIQLE